MAYRSFVALGDSFTEGLADHLDAVGRHRGWADRVADVLGQAQPGFRYANLAVRGRLLRQVVAEQCPVAVEMAPDLVSLAAGVNDALRRNYDLDEMSVLLDTAVTSLRDGGADVMVFAFGDPSRRSRLMARVAERLALYREATLEIAQRRGAIVVDFWGAAVFDEDLYWDGDRLHLSPAGHALAARAALHALGLADDSWRTPPPTSPRPSISHRATGHLTWSTSHLLPWFARRLRGISSGDGLAPKRPALTPLAEPSTGDPAPGPSPS